MGAAAGGTQLLLGCSSSVLTNLANVDDLVLLVRNQATRVYVAEAVAAYRGGAHRVALIALWVTVAFDLVTKLRKDGTR